MRLLFSQEAKQEFDTAKRYYEMQLTGLGREFHDEVRAALRRIVAWPLACPIERGDIRRAVLSRFPYKLMYSIEADHVYVIAVAHQHRKPDYWTDRLDP
jgi:plasmid stabilization system protein ParE